MELPKEVEGVDHALIKSWILNGYKQHLKTQLTTVEQTSYSIGLKGEENIANILGGSLTRANFCGDIIADNIMIEVKNYSVTVPTKEVDKFYRDLAKFEAGIFISLRSRIAKKELFEFDFNNKAIFICSSNSKLLQTAHQLLSQHLKSLGVRKLDKLVSRVEELKSFCCMEDLIRELEDLKRYNDLKLTKVCKQLIFKEANLKSLISNIKVECDQTHKSSLDKLIEFIPTQWPGSQLAKNANILRTIFDEQVEYSYSAKEIIINDTKFIILKTKTKVAKKIEGPLLVNPGEEVKAGWLIKDLNI
jgi:hypothetical protein